MLTNALRDLTHVIKMRAVPILMVHSNVSVKLAFQGMGIYAQVFMDRFQKENYFQVAPNQ